MQFIFKNKLKHLIILVLSTLLLYPLVSFLNASYYTTISRVNYWEEKSIVSLISYILNNTDNERVATLKENLEDIKYFEIKITYNEKIIIHKELNNFLPDLDKKTEYEIKGYKLILAKRKYDTAQDDYIYYLNAWMYPSKLIGNRIFTILLGHMTIFFLLELIWIVLSVQFRLNQLKKSIKQSQ